MAKLRGLLPDQKPRFFGPGAFADYRRDGTVAARKTPRKSSNPLSPITEQQVALWDDALRMTTRAISQQVIEADEIAAGSGFYRRDILIAACYGHMVSWPGWGIFPNGPAAPPLYVTKRGNRSYPPFPLGAPQPINEISSYSVDDSGDPIVIDATTFHPSSPLLERFCCEPQKVLIKVLKNGVEQPHGYKLFFPCEPTEYAPQTGYGTSHHWELPAADFDPPCQNCALVVVQKGTQPVLPWTSLRIPCPTGHGPPPVTPGYYYRSVAGITGPHGFTPSPAFVAAANTQLDGELACYMPAHVQIVQREFKFVDGGFIPQNAGMTETTLPGELCGPSGPEGYYSADPVDPNTSNIFIFGDNYVWGYLLRYT